MFFNFYKGVLVNFASIELLWATGPDTQPRHTEGFIESRWYQKQLWGVEVL